MDSMTWSIQTSPLGAVTTVVSEYVLNELGIFFKSEYRVPKKNLLNAVTGFRIGNEPIPNTDYRAAPGNRNALLWYKITHIVENKENHFTLYGNKSDSIDLIFPPENKNQILKYIAEMQKKNPRIIAADEKAAGWICWRDDDEWENPYAPLSEMIQEELTVKRFLEPEILEETVLATVLETSFSSVNQVPTIQSEVKSRSNFCTHCGQPLQPEGNFCHNCGAKLS